MKTKNILILACLVTSFSLYGQSSSNVDINISSPQVADFMRYTGTSITKNVGRIDFNIELVRLKENDFDLPVILSYNSSGFNPLKNDGIVGLNWFLNCGGVIYREVNGIPDDK